MNTTTHNPITIRLATHLAAIVNAAQTGARVAWLADGEDGRTDSHGDVVYGTARSIGDENGNFARAHLDIRDCFLRITTDSGWEWFPPVAWVTNWHEAGLFAINPSEITDTVAEVDAERAEPKTPSIDFTIDFANGMGYVWGRMDGGTKVPGSSWEFAQLYANARAAATTFAPSVQDAFREWLDTGNVTNEVYNPAFWVCPKCGDGLDRCPDARALAQARKA